LPLNVLLVASEAVPLAKTGGLGDMVSAYAVALREAGVDAAILIPAYPNALQMVEGLQKVASLTALPGGDGALYRGRMPDSGVPVILLRMDHLYAREGLYQDAKGRDYEDNAIRFASLSAAAVNVSSKVALIWRSVSRISVRSSRIAVSRSSRWLSSSLTCSSASRYSS